MIFGRIPADMLVAMPDEVRAALGVAEGDLVAYAIEGDRVVMKRGSFPLDEDGKPDMFVGNLSAFTEWADEHDRIYDQLADR